MDTNYFIRHHWKYYLSLENQVINTFQFSSLDKVNDSNFSFEYLKLIQIICSEIDVLCKSFCNFLGNSETDTIAKYAATITVKHTNIKTTTVYCKENPDNIYEPFTLWEYTFSTNVNGVQRVNGTPPKWWTIYNKLKHDRMSTNSLYNKENYKLANQNNVMNALAGLFLLEMFYYKDLAENENPNNPNIPGQPSILFELKDWGNGIMYGNDLFLKFV